MKKQIAVSLARMILLALCAMGFLFLPSFASAQDFRPEHLPWKWPPPERKVLRPDKVDRILKLETHVLLPASAIANNVTTGLSMRSRYAYGLDSAGRYDAPLGEYWGQEANPVAVAFGFKRNTAGAILTVDAMHFGVGWFATWLNRKGKETHNPVLRLGAVWAVGAEIFFNGRAAMHDIHTMEHMNDYVTARTGYRNVIVWRSK